MKADISSAELAGNRRLFKFITQNLEATYGVPRNDSHEDPLDELIATILSQSTTNINSRKHPVFPMDTHIFRILRRMGILPEKLNDELAHQWIETMVPPKKHYSLHINLITHGRRICQPQNPKCKQCSLIEYCKFGQAVNVKMLR
jgi:endonuclease III